MKKLQKLLNIYFSVIEALKEYQELQGQKNELEEKDYAIVNLKWAIREIENVIIEERKKETEGE